MENRVRQIRKEICLTDQEEQIIKSKMAELGTHNFGSYARKMLIDGYIINVDYTELRKLCAAVSKIGSNINQIGYRMKITGNFYAEDIDELHAGMAKVNDALIERLKEEIKWEGKSARIFKKNREAHDDLESKSCLQNCFRRRDHRAELSCRRSPIRHRPYRIRQDDIPLQRQL